MKFNDDIIKNRTLFLYASLTFTLFKISKFRIRHAIEDKLINKYDRFLTSGYCFVQIIIFFIDRTVISPNVIFFVYIVHESTHNIFLIYQGILYAKESLHFNWTDDFVFLVELVKVASSSTLLRSRIPLINYEIPSLLNVRKWVKYVSKLLNIAISNIYIV